MEQEVKQRKARAGMRGWLKILLAVVLTLVIVLGGLCLALGRGGLALMEGWLLAKYAFVDTQADLDAAADQALYGLVSGLGDRWSYYLSEEDYAYVSSVRENNYVGVGILVLVEPGEGILIQRVLPGGPAEAAGLVMGERIVAVDGISAIGDEDAAMERVKGDPGSEVTLTLLGIDGTQRDVTCIRNYVNSPAASGQMLDETVGYVYLEHFYTGAAVSFRSEVDYLLEQGAEKLIVDLRYNPGGYIKELKEILDYLLPEGPVFTEKYRWWFEDVYESDAACVDLPMVVLVNGETYSAAELLAAQLRESVSAPIVGEVTSGKGYSQTTFFLPNKGGLGLSTATYCTGSGHSLIGEGITPDVELPLGETSDEQLQAAYDLITK